MTSDTRTALEEGAILRLFGPDTDENPGAKSFRVERWVAGGASTLCYEARDAHGARGILKEYYPRSVRAARRMDGTLVPVPEDEGAFQRGAENYAAQHRKIMDLADSSGDLRTFFPRTELYDGDETVYVWDPGPPRRTFEDLCRRGLETAARCPEQIVHEHLSAVRALAQCIQCLHEAGYAHRDIKPSNFGFLSRAGEILPQTIALFDTDTVAPFSDAQAGPMGTAGYTDGAASGAACARTDIYAIGCVLFRALVAGAETEETGGVYKDAWYSRLEELVNSSPLIGRIAGNAGDLLRASVLRLLRRSLGAPAARYLCCEELLTDIDRALYYAAPLARRALEKALSEQWELTGTHALRDLTDEDRARIAIAFDFFRHPLRARTRDGKQHLRVGIAGFDPFAQMYLDIVLELAQTAADHVEVVVLSGVPAEVSSYLEARPALPQFFAINGRAPAEESYGAVTFVDADGSFDADYAAQFFSGTDIAFVSLGEDVASVRAARSLQRALQEEAAPQILFARRTPGPCVKDRGIRAVDITGPDRTDPVFADLDRRAFNVQLVWEPSLAVHFPAIEERFREPYNYCASIISAVAASYRSLETEETEDGSRSVFSDSDRRNRQIWKEHRRWVTEKVCAGWSPASDLAVCAAHGGKARLDERREHACIVRSRPDHQLKEMLARYGDAFWDTAGAKDLAALDGLDRVSMALHQLLAERAKASGSTQAVFTHFVPLLRDIAGEDKETLRALEEWVRSMQEAAGGSTRAAADFTQRMHAFLAAAKRLPADHARQARRVAEELRHVFGPILAAARREDFKAIDDRMVDSTEFIASFSTSLLLVLPIGQNDTGDRAKAAICAAAMNPRELLYVARLSGKNELAGLASSAQAVQEFLAGRNVRAQVQMLVFMDEGTAADLVQEDLELPWPAKIIVADGAQQTARAFGEATKDALQRVDKVAAPRGSALAEQLAKQLSRSDQLFEITEEDGAVEVWQGERASWRLPADVYLGVSDVISLAGAEARRSPTPDFDVVAEELRDLYAADREAWKELCRVLQRYDDQAGTICMIILQAEVSPQTLVYHLPAACRDAVEELAQALCSAGVLSRADISRGPYGDILDVTLEGCCASRSAMDSLFGQAEHFGGIEPLRVTGTAGAGSVRVYRDVLSVQDAAFTRNGQESAAALLEVLAERGLVQNLQRKKNAYAFSYVSHAVKKLLTDPATILEIVTLRCLPSRCHPDDICRGLTIDLPEQGLQQRLSCMLTKGTRCWLIVCAQPEDVSDDLAKRLALLRDAVGVNAEAVIVTDSAGIRSPAQEPVMNRGVKVLSSMEEGVFAALKCRT